MSDKKALTPEQVEALANTCAENEPQYREFVGNLASPAATHNHSNNVVYGLADALDRLRPLSLELDHYKRALTYGEKLRINPLPNLGGGVGERPVYWADHKETVHGLTFEQRADMIHGILGIITEAIELAPILEHLLHGNSIDGHNLVEELGDGKFYTTLVETAAGYQPGQVVYRNVTKLAQRYKGGFFTRDGALNRDLDAERVALGDESLMGGVHNANHRNYDRPVDELPNAGETWAAAETDPLHLIMKGEEVVVKEVYGKKVTFSFTKTGREMSISEVDFTRLFRRTPPFDAE